MAITSTGWELTSADRNTDTSLGSSWSQRRNWSITRFRWNRESAPATDDYPSEEGDYSSSISWENGGVTESIEPPANAISSRSWDSNTEFCVKDSLWVTNGSVTYEACYVPFQVQNRPEPSFVNVLFSCIEVPTYRWVIAEMTAAQAAQPPISIAISGGIMSGTSGTLQTPNYALGPSGASLPTLTTQTFTGNGSFSGSGTSSIKNLNNRTGQFYCVSDKQSYTNNGVDWYKQTQTWKYQEFWG